MASVLINDYTGTDISYKEYLITTPVDASYMYNILMGYNYETNELLMSINGVETVVGIFPINELNSTDNYRLVFTIEYNDLNNSIIPYSFYFNFGEDNNLYGDSNSSLNPFLVVLPRPTIDLSVITSLENPANISINWVSDAVDSVYLRVTNPASVVIYEQSGLLANGSIDLSGLGHGNYTAYAIAYNEPLIYGTDELDFKVEGSIYSNIINERGILGFIEKRDLIYKLSLGVNTTETDISQIIENFTGTNGCYAGKFRWGPCLEATRVSNEFTLRRTFGTPSNNIDNKIDYHVAAQFLEYSKKLDVVRLASKTADGYLNTNSTSTVYFNNLQRYTDNEPAVTILNDMHYTFLNSGNLTNNTFIARYPGDYGNNIGVSFTANNLNVADIEHKYDINISDIKNRFYFSRGNVVYYKRDITTQSARSLFDINDFISIDYVFYRIKDIKLDDSNGRVISTEITNQGFNYTTPPIVSFIGGDGSNVSAKANLKKSGSIKSVDIVYEGEGYTEGTYPLSFTIGTGATGTITFDINGSIESVDITGGGIGYTDKTEITFDAGNPSIKGRISPIIGYSIESITILNGGINYTVPPTIEFTGDGDEAEATAYVGLVDDILFDRLYDGGMSSGYLHSIDNTLINSFMKKWRWANVIGNMPLLDHIHIVVFDSTGNITGIKNSILEKYENVSLISEEKTNIGLSNYWVNRVNTLSEYIRIGMKDILSIPLFITHGDISIQTNNLDWISNYVQLVGGNDAFEEMGLDDDMEAYDLFKDPEQCDAPILIGNYRCMHTVNNLPNYVLANYLIDITSRRKDSMAFLSCRRESVVNNPNKEMRDVLKDASFITSSSYAEMDSGWKYIHDKYNDNYVWIPTSGDHAGCYARTDNIRDFWASSAGELYGLFKNTKKIAFNPNEVQRDRLYNNRINPIVSFPNIGAIILGDKTLLSTVSSFNRIPTRRLFISVEKTIETASLVNLFEYNDIISRTQIRTILEAFLGEVKSKRGISDYRIIIDETNNTPAVIASGGFKGRILIRPNYSISFVELNFSQVNSIITFEDAMQLL